MNPERPDRDVILVFEEQQRYLSDISMMLHNSGFKKIYCINDPSKLEAFLDTTPVAVMLFGLHSASGPARYLLNHTLRQHSGLRTIVVSTLDDRETAVDCIKQGVLEFLVHPCDPDKLAGLVNSCFNRQSPRSTGASVRRGADSGVQDTADIFRPIVTRDRRMLTIFRYIEAIAPASQSVMITGETGTGKELVARAIHDASGRSGEFVTVNVAGLDDIMFSDTLFGHEKGAFTGAERERRGLIEKAAGGTLFLDEIGDLNNASQVKLLRLLQDGEYYPLGSDTLKHSTARVLVATNSLLEQKMEQGCFRNDLYFRLCSHHIRLPALRERRGDIPLLVESFSREASKELGKQPPSASSDALDALGRYEFPGNVRELRGLVHNAVAVSASGHLVFPRFTQPAVPVSAYMPAIDFSDLPRPAGRPPTLQEAEEFLIREALKSSGGNQRSAAAILGISRQALNKRLLRDPSLIDSTRKG